MESGRGTGTELHFMFVSHPVAGIHRIPAAWLDACAPSGFRPATPDEIRWWHEERGLAVPEDLAVAQQDPPDDGGAMTLPPYVFT